ncbi:inosine triphosphate pyrophosphatase-like [Saccostrea cucullata]|uniref:inosine triphosphate pyrophosphatase-like n=1 Tax=Saccostrea cuccullata TaxID=36930 RepID=UPI002ED3A465
MMFQANKQKEIKEIVLCTGNKSKLKEFMQILGEDFPYKITNADIDLPEFQGEPEEVAREKCKLAAEQLKCPVVTDDTSLCFNALGGLPGPYIKWFLKKLKPEGLHKILHGFEDKSATAMCILAYSSGEKDSEVKLFCGKAPGKIVKPRGLNDFGWEAWDRCFQPEGFTQTYAEMPEETTNAISHRFRAVKIFKKHFQDGS